MSSATLTPSKRKIIDLNEDTFKTLSIMAIQKGTNLKKYIEDVLNELAENYGLTSVAKIHNIFHIYDIFVC